MTINQIQNIIDEMKTCLLDYDRCNSLEGELHEKFIQYVANGGQQELYEKANLIISGCEIVGRKWGPGC